MLKTFTHLGAYKEEIHYLSILEVRSPRCWQGHTTPGGAMEEFVLCLF